MKKCFFILAAALIAFGTLLVSCNANVEAPAEELVSISFENGSARALSSNLEGFAPETYYWKYAAKKADSSNLVSGETATYDADGAKWVKEGSQGLGTGTGTDYESYKVQGFSQGLWNFKLFAYKDAAGTQLVYSGETTGVLLQTNGNHRVDVVVSPAQSGNGTLIVKITGEDKIILNPASGSLIPNTKIRLGIDKLVGETATTIRALSFIEADYSNAELLPGTYKVTVQFTNDDATVIYAAGSVVSTVYSNLTTTIKGSLNEVITYADFGAEQNPDIITTTIGTAAITQGTTSSTVNFTSTTETKVTASMPTAAAKSLIATMEQELDAKTSTSESTTSNLTLNLSVNTTEATESTITYEIGMEATLVYEKIGAASQETTTTKSNVETLDDFVIVKIEMQKGLSEVKVMHDDVEMVACADLATLEGKTKSDPGAAAGFFFYEDPYTGDNTKAMLYIRTYRFSPFKLSYKVPSYVASVGDKRYQTLTEAISAAEAGETILILKDITTDDGYVINKNLSIDTDGHTITVKNGSNFNNRAFKIDSGKLTIFGSGTIVSVGSGTTSSDGAGCYGAFRVEANGQLEVSDMTLTNARPWGLNVKVLGGEATLTDVTINSSFGGGIEVTEAVLGTQSKKGSATLTDCTFTQTGYFDHCSTTLSVSGGSSLTVNSGTYTSDNYALYVFSSGGVITVNGGAFSGNKDGVAIVAAIDTNTYPQYTGGLAISGGSFTGGYSITSPAYLSITGGTYSVDPSAYVADGYKAVKDGSVWYVVPVTEDDQIKITGTGFSSYMTFAEFRDSVNAGNDYADCTVTLLRDIDLAGIDWVPIGTKAHPFRGTFDGNNKTISNLSNAGYTAYSEVFEANPQSYGAGDFALFGSVEGTVVIKDFDISAYIYGTGRYSAAVVSGPYNDVFTNLTISNIDVSGIINAKERIAGVIALSPNYTNQASILTINQCNNHATIIGDRAGGILSNNGCGGSNPTGHTTVQNCTNAGTIISQNGKENIAAGIINNTNTTNPELLSVIDCSNTGKILANTAYNLTANSYIYNNDAGDLGISIIGETVGDYTNPITDLAFLMNLYYCYSDPYVDENNNSYGIRWDAVEKRIGTTPTSTSNTQYVGLFAGLEYNVNTDIKAVYSFDYKGTTYEFKFANMADALEFLNYSAMYNNLKVYEDFEWTSAYTKEGDAPGNYSIDLNGYTMTLSAPIHSVNGAINGLQKTVVIKNGHIAFKSDYSGKILDHVERYGRIDFSNVTLDNSVSDEIISIYPSTSGYDPITLNIDSSCVGFAGKKIRCLSPNTGGGDALILNDTSITMSDSRWVVDNAEKVLTI